MRKPIKNTILFIGFFLLLAQVVNSQALLPPVRLRTDLLLNTDVVSSAGFKTDIMLSAAVDHKKENQFATISSAQPVFNWQVNMAVKKVTAYRLMVASSVALLNSNKADYWDSKKIISGNTQTVYAGKPLLANNIYYWKVQFWNDKEEASAFSDLASFYYDVPKGSDPFSHYPLAAEIQQPVDFRRLDNGSCFFDFGKDGFGQLQLHLTSEKYDSIWVEAAEALESPFHISKTGGNIRYIRRGLFVKKGTHDYTIDWPINEKRNSRNPILMPDYIGEVFPFRYVSISNLKGPVEIGSVQRKIIYYPFDENASYFNSSDSILNKVWELCKYSIKATSFMGYYVDGDRERVPYEADALINQLSHYAVDAEYSMARRSMDYLLFHPTWPTEWSLQNISLAWNDYLYTGDNSFLIKYYTELQKKILMPLARQDGLISTRTGKQTDDFLTSIHMVKDFDGKHGLKDIVDWPQNGSYIGNEKEYAGETDGFVFTDYNAVVNAWYYEELGLMQKIAAALGKSSDAIMYESKAKQVYQSYQRVFRDANSGLFKDGDTTSHTSLHANMFALAFGLVPKADMPAVTNFIKTRKMACSVYGSQFLLDALYDAGQDDYALELMNATTQRSWYNMLRVGSTISMEAWDKVYKPNLDWNHAWGAAPANIIARKLMGVEPTSPGAAIIRIKPQIGNLQFAELKTTILKGELFVSIHKKEDADIMEITIPGATIANVYMAFNPAKTTLTVDGMRTTVKPFDGYYLIKNVAAGRHVFTLQ